MKFSITFVLFCAFLAPVPSIARDAKSEIAAVLASQVEAWNRGDIPTFVNSYADNCIFVGKQHVLTGRAQLLARYQKSYPTPEAMGKLTFTNLVVTLLDAQVATVTADWHLDRATAGGGPVGGNFSLVFHRQKGVWKIALDHTS
jgi:uncharacterized protein (TIGR02246 family)